MARAIIMFSGGLDSVVATHLLKQQGIDIVALHFVLPFYSGLGFNHQKVRAYAEHLGVRLRIEEEGDEFLAMIKDPEFGFGRNANPCLDCRIHRLVKAAQIMRDEGASFIATGEVVGQRPMSQRMDCLHAIQRRSGLSGLLLRPLSAKLLAPTKPEIEKIVDRERLMGIAGRGRGQQLAYARTYGLQHATPAGGCLLTHAATARRYLDLSKYAPGFSLFDLKLLAWGRHFRLTPEHKIVVSRTESENAIFERIVRDNDYRFEMTDTLGPLAIAPGTFTLETLATTAALTARFSRLRNAPLVRVTVRRGDQHEVVEVKPADDELCDRLRI